MAGERFASTSPTLDSPSMATFESRFPTSDGSHSAGAHQQNQLQIQHQPPLQCRQDRRQHHNEDEEQDGAQQEQEEDYAWPGPAHPANQALEALNGIAFPTPQAALVVLQGVAYSLGFGIVQLRNRRRKTVTGEPGEVCHYDYQCVTTRSRKGEVARRVRRKCPWMVSVSQLRRCGDLWEIQLKVRTHNHPPSAAPGMIPVNRRATLKASEHLIKDIQNQAMQNQMRPKPADIVDLVQKRTGRVIAPGDVKNYLAKSNRQARAAAAAEEGVEPQPAPRGRPKTISVLDRQQGMISQQQQQLQQLQQQFQQLQQQLQQALPPLQQRSQHPIPQQALPQEPLPQEQPPRQLPERQLSPQHIPRQPPQRQRPPQQRHPQQIQAQTSSGSVG